LAGPSGPFRVLLSPKHLAPLSHDLPVSGVSSVSLVMTLLSSGRLSAFPLNSDRGDQPLDLGGFRPSFRFVGGFEFSSDDKFGNIIVLFEVEELSDFGSPFWPEPFVARGGFSVGEAFDGSGSVFDNDHRAGSDVVRVDASTDRLSLPFTFPARPVARSTFPQQKSDPVRLKDTLFHGETLLVFTTGQPGDVTFKVVTKVIEADFVGDPLVEDVFVLVLVIDFEHFLLASGLVGDVKLHVL